MMDEDRGGLEDSEGEDELFDFPELDFHWEDEHEDKKPPLNESSAHNGVRVSQLKVLISQSF